jgi:raffinose/stachyose/melibiose transport system permease protein
MFRKLLWHGVFTVFLVVFSLLVLIPFIWMFVMSFRTTGEILANPYGLPTNIKFDNYIRLFSDPQILFYRYIWNSAIVTAGALVITIILSALGGYGFARKRFYFPLRGILFTVLLFSLMLPPQAMYIPQFIMMSKYRLLNTRLSLILLYAAYAVTISTYLLKTYFSQLPEELEESARIDGAGDFQVFLQIMLPLTKPIMATIILINFKDFWNELLIAMTMVTRTEIRTLPLAMMYFVGDNASDYAMAAASLVVGVLPLLILYLFLADKFVEGMTAGAVKG